MKTLLMRDHEVRAYREGRSADITVRPRRERP
jgi:hypothetical protein